MIWVHCTGSVPNMVSFSEIEMGVMAAGWPSVVKRINNACASFMGVAVWALRGFLGFLIFWGFGASVAIGSSVTTVIDCVNGSASSRRACWAARREGICSLPLARIRVNATPAKMLAPTVRMFRYLASSAIGPLGGLITVMVIGVAILDLLKPSTSTASTTS